MTGGKRDHYNEKRDKKMLHEKGRSKKAVQKMREQRGDEEAAHRVQQQAEVSYTSHGFRTTRCTNGTTYTGYQNTKKEKHGHGVVHYVKGGWYEGKFKNGSRHGHGVMHMTDGRIYVGEFCDDKKHGNGYMMAADGTWSQRTYEQNRRTKTSEPCEPPECAENLDPNDDGWHHHRFLRRAVYDKLLEKRRSDVKPKVPKYSFFVALAKKDREAAKNKKSPSLPDDMYQFPDGRYEGEVDDESRRHGLGTFTREKDGTTYEGIWERDVFVEGTRTKSNGEQHIGRWTADGLLNDKHAIIYSKEGKLVYEGAIILDRMFGFGEQVYHLTGDMYEGYWEDNRRHGQGKYTYANGIVYDGGWSNDKMEGFGTVTYGDGTVLTGQWDAGNQVSGTYLFPNQSTFKFDEPSTPIKGVFHDIDSGKDVEALHKKVDGRRLFCRRHPANADTRDTPASNASSSPTTGTAEATDILFEIGDSKEEKEATTEEE